MANFDYFMKSDRKVLALALIVAVVAIAAIFLVGGRETKTPLTAADSLAMNGVFNGNRNVNGNVNGNRNVNGNGYYNGNGNVNGNGNRYGSYRGKPHKYYNVEGKRAELFPFDPNKADSTDLLRLGLQPWQVRNIYKYRANGGIYRKKEDFARLYGLTQGQYQAMEPYIEISSEYQPASTMVEERQKERDTVMYPVKLKPMEHIVLNTADTTMLKKVPGIGSGYARRIISYGERLGGYYDVSQLLDIEGFPKEALQYFVVSNPHLRKININQLTLGQLKAHPDISFNQAKAIAEYRRLKGPIKNIRQLQLQKDFNDDDFRRLEPYVEY